VFLLEKAAIDRAGGFWSPVVGRGSGRDDVVAHLLTQQLRLPAECGPIKLRHTLAIVVGHLEVNDRIHVLTSVWLVGDSLMCGEASDSSFEHTQKRSFRS